MSALDWVVLSGTLGAFVLYGLWRGRESRDLSGYLVAGRSMPWPMVALSVMATQASAITFLSTPGQGAVDGLRFVQFYFGLPLAMIVLCALAIPAYQRLNVFTAYQFLEQRFDGKTRSLAAGLFLVQRGLAAGLTIYAPSLVLSVLLGWDVKWVCLLLGGLVALSTALGGSRAVSHAHFLQFLIIMGTMALAFGLIVTAFPPGVSALDAASVAGRLGRMNALDLRFDPDSRYNLWSGLIGGFFLQLSYFGTDQSQVGRYLTGQSVAQSRLGLLFNGMAKVPMQFFILLLGVMVFAFYQFNPPPLTSNPRLAARMNSGAHAAEWQALEARHNQAFEARKREAEAFVAARQAGDRAAGEAAGAGLERAHASLTAVREESQALVRRADPAANPNDTNYIFLTFVLAHLPVGVIGLVFAAVFAASMNSTAAELNALTSTTVVDVWRRLSKAAPDRKHDLKVARLAMFGWTAFAIAFAEWAAGLGSLVEAVNILGSLFYGTILGIFMSAFLLKRVGGTAVFLGALAAEAAVVACFLLTKISFLWYNLIGCLLVMGAAVLIQAVFDARRARAA